LHHLDRPVIVAMVAVRVMQVAVDQVIDMVAVGHRFMAAAGAVAVGLVVAVALVFRGAAIRVFGADFQHMLVHVIAVGMVQMTVVQVINVILMADGHMAALRPVLMGMAFVNRVVVGIHDEDNGNRIPEKINNSAASGDPAGFSGMGRCSVGGEMRGEFDGRRGEARGFVGREFVGDRHADAEGAGDRAIRAEHRHGEGSGDAGAAGVRPGDPTEVLLEVAKLDRLAACRRGAGDAFAERDQRDFFEQRRGDADAGDQFEGVPRGGGAVDGSGLAGEVGEGGGKEGVKIE